MYISFKEKNISEKERKEKNKNYIEQKIKKEKQYFDTMFEKVDKTIKLDDNQRKIILTDEKYTIVIAGAGSGKTTTITAKVKYLLDKRHIKDDEILIISFTNKAVQELDNRINIEFNHKVKITTFHKLANEIIKNNTTPNQKILKENNIIKNYVKKNPPKKIPKIIKTIFKRLINEYYDKTTNMCKQYISLYKSKYPQLEFKNIKYKHEKDVKLKNYIEQVYNYYQSLLEENNYIDFDDMINKAINIIENNEPKIIKKIKYKYIIIDEYQDISENRYQLIKKIERITNAKIMVVGDDWQTIYSFASSNINLFTKFKENVEYCEILKIEKTYRNSQELINIAGDFIQKNKNQIKKELISNKSLKNPITVLQHKEKTFNKILVKTIEYIIKKYGEEKNILILGRYTFDIKKIDNDEFIKNNNKIIYKKKPKIKIDYLTVHTSKGLGYDNVILINADNQKFGFPSKVKNNTIFEPLLTTEKSIKYAEERRLFYVALTRTKNEIIILTKKYNNSKFIKEIKNKCNKTLK